MPFGAQAIVNLLKLTLTNVPWAGVGDGPGLLGSTIAGSWFLSLHLASPGAGGDQTTNEISYGGYARASVARSSGGWVVTGNPATLAATVSWPEMVGGVGGLATFLAIGKASSGPGELFLIGSLTPPLLVVNGNVPKITPATTITLT